MTRHQRIRAALVDAGVDIDTADRTAAELSKRGTQPMNRYDDERDEFLKQLTDLLESARGADQRVNASELHGLGIPRDQAHALAKASHDIRTRAQARQTATQATNDIFDKLEADAEMSPSELANKYLPPT